jgi:hypothetical protein
VKGEIFLSLLLTLAVMGYTALTTTARSSILRY